MMNSLITTTSLALGSSDVPWLDANAIIDQFGQFAPYAVALIIFIETAFILTSFLPGDSLLFVLGITLAASTEFPIWLAIPLVIVSAFAGSQVGFLTGHAVGPVLFERRHTWIFNPTFVAKAHEYFDKFGPRAIILARFVPIVRALVPMLAGISKMDRRTFLINNILGATVWVTGLVGIGFLLGEVPLVADHIDTAILIVIIVTSLPFPIELLREWIIRKRQR
jgi:membrane-associated protein